MKACERVELQDAGLWWLKQLFIKTENVVDEAAKQWLAWQHARVNAITFNTFRYVQSPDNWLFVAIQTGSSKEPCTSV